MLTTSLAVAQRLIPGRVRVGADRLRTMWAIGLFERPGELLSQWRHRATFARLQKAFFYHRYATAVLLGHEIGLFEALSAGPLTSEEAAEKTGVHFRAALALLRILESEGFVSHARQRYTLNEAGKMFLSRSSATSLSPMLDLMAAQAAAFAELPAGLASGTVPTALDIFDDKGRYKAYLSAVNNFLDMAGRDLLHRIQLPPIERFIVGSMGVSFSAVLMKLQRQARVTYGCLDHLVTEIPSLREHYEVPAHRVDGMHSHGGDPSADRWGEEDFDLVFLTKKMILEPESQIGEKFARKAFDVLRPGGVAIFWETLHPDDKPTPLPRAMEAVLDLGASPNGPVNTEGSMRTLLEGIGYHKIQYVHCLDGTTSFAVAFKP